MFPVSIALGAVPEAQQHALSVNGEQAGPIALFTPTHEIQLSTNIFWPHIPKTSTTFGRTFFSYACQHPEDFSDVKTTHPPKPRDGACDATLAEDQRNLVNRAAKITQGPDKWGSWYHVHAPPNVRIFTLLREPDERLRSASHQILTFGNNRTCCAQIHDQEDNVRLPGMSWGWSADTRNAALAAYGNWGHPENVVGLGSNNTDPQGLVRFKNALEHRNALWGCQTKMLVGHGCFESHKLTDAEIAHAHQIVSSGEHFVGLTERYAESICLFHIKYGGKLYDFEVKFGETPAFAGEGTQAHAGHGAAARETGTPEALWHGGVEDADVTLYALARDRFEADVEDHSAEMSSCMNNLRTSNPH